MEWLKEFLGEELYNQVKEKLEGDDKVKLINAGDGSYIPKAKFDQVNEQKKDLETQVQSYKGIAENYEKVQGELNEWKELAEENKPLKKKLDELSKSTDDLKTQLDDANSKATEYQTQLKDTQINSAIEKTLIKNNAKYPDLILSKFDKSKIEFAEDGSIKGVEEQFNELKESYKELFGETKIIGNQPNKGGSPEFGTNLDDMSDEEFFKMKDNQNNKK